MYDLFLEEVEKNVSALGNGDVDMPHNLFSREMIQFFAKGNGVRNMMK